MPRKKKKIESPLKPVPKLSSLQSLTRKPLPKSLAQFGVKIAIQRYASQVEDNYTKARLINVLSLSPRLQSQYRLWMDITRRMQAVLDGDPERVSPQSLQALRALWTGWVRSSLKSSWMEEGGEISRE
jgi:hypothetical protein